MLDRGFFIHHLTGHFTPRTLGRLCCACRAFRDWIDCDEFGRALMKRYRYIDNFEMFTFISSKSDKWSPSIVIASKNLYRGVLEWIGDVRYDSMVVQELFDVPNYRCELEWFHKCLAYPSTAHLAIERITDLEALALSNDKLCYIVNRACALRVYTVVDYVLDKYPDVGRNHEYICRANLDYVFNKTCHANIKMFLHDAIFYGRLRLVEFLLDNYADAAARYAEHGFKMAMRCKQIRIVKMLSSRYNFEIPEAYLAEVERENLRGIKRFCLRLK